jgi:hypothetical protein
MCCLHSEFHCHQSRTFFLVLTQTTSHPCRTLSQEHYLSANKNEKFSVSCAIVDQVRSLNPPGRFLARDKETDSYFDVGNRKAIEKAGQALRDGTSRIRKDRAFLQSQEDPYGPGSLVTDTGSPKRPSLLEHGTEVDGETPMVSIDSSRKSC